jgi:hypothetical protein
MGLLVIIKFIASGFIKGVSDFFEMFIKYPKLMLVILCFVFAMAAVFRIDYLHAEVITLQSQKETLAKQNTQLMSDITGCTSVNKINQDVIDKLSVVKTDSVKQITLLKVVQSVNVAKTDSIRQSILVSKPEDDGAIAKVLADTIQTIQTQRDTQ